jgi:hypothetical protein
MVRRTVGTTLMLLLAACAAPQRSPDSPYYVLPENSRLVLLRAIAIPPPGVSVWLQNGEVVTTRDRYAPACKLEMRTRTEDARSVTPDTFVVKRVSREDEAVAIDSPVRHVGRVGSEGDGDSPMAYEMRTVWYLESPRQPDVFRLTCAHWDRPWFPQHLTLNQITKTLQGLFRIEPASE